MSKNLEIRLSLFFFLLAGIALVVGFVLLTGIALVVGLPSLASRDAIAAVVVTATRAAPRPTSLPSGPRSSTPSGRHGPTAW